MPADGATTSSSSSPPSEGSSESGETSCGVDEYVEGGLCLSCDPGTVNEPGDDAEGPDTVCDAIQCRLDEHVQDHACVACPPGTTNAPGDDPSQEDTTCTVDGDACFVALGVPCDEYRDAYIKSSNAEPYDEFGSALALDGDTLAVSSIFESSSATGVDGDQSDNSTLVSGAVYVFVRAEGGWVQQAYLKASNVDDHDAFGSSLSLHGDTLVVGAPSEESASVGVDGDESDDSEIQAGAAYVFARVGGSWSQEAYLKASNTGDYDHFGEAVAVHGDSIAVAAPAEGSASSGIGGDQSDDSAYAAGAVYVFVRAASQWSQQAYVKPSNVDAGDRFGRAVALDGDTLVVGSPSEDSAATGIDSDASDNTAVNAGATFVFVRTGGVWSQQAYIKPQDVQNEAAFGAAVDVEGDTLVVGAPGTIGSAFVFTRTAGSWAQSAHLTASRADVGERFGADLALHGDDLVVGARFEDSQWPEIDGPQGDNGAMHAGAAYLFRRDDVGSWLEPVFIKAFNPGQGDVFGTCVGVSDGLLAVGAPEEDGAGVGVQEVLPVSNAINSGVVYVFRTAP